MGSNFTSAVKTDGTVWAWGNNFLGNLGLNDQIRRSSPVQVGSLTTWFNVSSGNSHTIALLKES
jgi:alpha-tubulin suppressor-like RCC1 family protein